MADSAYWRDLAKQFRALPSECKMLRADRYPVDDVTDELSHWQLTGTATAKALVDALARRAASEIQDLASSDLLAAWLEALIKRGGVQFHSQTILRGNNPDGRIATSADCRHLVSITGAFSRLLQYAGISRPSVRV